jgi:polyisoprenyl-teichoic acid--peptidoglycan teichoic acid transferase
VLVALAALVVLAVVAALIVWLPDLVRRDVDRSTDPQGPGVAASAVPQTAVLLIRTTDGRTAAGITLLAAGDDGSASATFIPATTLVEIPGVGLDRLGLAQQYGGAALTEAAVENALGIELDGTLTVDTAGLGALLQRAGGAELDVPDRLVERSADGTGTVVFEAGEQYLNGVRLAQYWSFAQRGETELDTFPRQQRALDAMLRALDDDELRQGLLGRVPPEIATDMTADEVRGLFAGLAEAAAAEVLAYQLLPVAPFGSADESLGTSYQLRDDEVAELVAERLAGSVPDGGPTGAVAVQLLNGVGVPGVGQQVDERLEGLPVRIVRTDNARSFDFPQTQIVIYDETPALLQAARQVQQALGVGTILVSRQPRASST